MPKNAPISPETLKEIGSAQSSGDVDEPLEFIVTGPARDLSAVNETHLSLALDEAGLTDPIERARLSILTDVVDLLSLTEAVKQIALWRGRIREAFERIGQMPAA
jgi:hypothetical protein